MIVERPFKNFLDLILFPKSSIFKKHKDIDDEDDDDSSTDSDSDEGDKKGKAKNGFKQGKDKHQSGKVMQEIQCGFCQDDAFFSTPGGQVCDCRCLVTKKRCKCIDRVGAI